MCNFRDLFYFFKMRVRFQILLQVEVCDRETHSRPICLFFALNYFSFMLHSVVASGSMCGLKIARSAPSISHLFFKDDNLLFRTVSIEEGETVMRVISDYGEGFKSMY